MDNKNEPKLVYVGNSHGFMGIKIEEGKIEVHVPKVYREKSKKELLAFLESISLAKTINNEDIESGDNEFVGEMWPIESYLWIINDYLENGYFYNREKKYFNDNKGK